MKTKSSAAAPSVDAPPTENMRKRNLQEAISLILMLSGRRVGMTYVEIIATMRENFGIEIKKQTLQRMIRAINLTPVRIIDDGESGHESRFTIDAPLDFRAAIGVGAQEIAEVEFAAKQLDNAGLSERARVLKNLHAKLTASIPDQDEKAKSKVAEAILEIEGVAAHPRPRIILPDSLITDLRRAILLKRIIDLTYQAPGKGERVYRVEPYGLVYGDSPYLLAQRPQDDKPDVGVWRLDRIHAVTETRETFTPRPGYTLSKLMASCFGVFREDPRDVELRFTPTAAAQAKMWQFHASQTVEDLPDGSLLVRFRAGGIVEMALHLVRYGDAVEVVKPQALRDELARVGAALIRRHATAPTPGSESTNLM